MFRSAANFLKKSADVDYPIFVRRMKMPDSLDGDCTFDGKKFVIRVNKKLTEEHSIDVALHEIAHAMSWDKDKDSHGPAWGLSYSKLYRKFLKYINE